jgi:hypothetical protein
MSIYHLDLTDAPDWDPQNRPIELREPAFQNGVVDIAFTTSRTMTDVVTLASVREVRRLVALLETWLTDNASDKDW